MSRDTQEAPAGTLIEPSIAITATELRDGAGLQLVKLGEPPNPPPAQYLAARPRDG
jgi:hypothetical protein